MRTVRLSPIVANQFKINIKRLKDREKKEKKRKRKRHRERKKESRGGFLKNFASPSGDGRWFRNLGNFKNIIKNLGF